MNSRFFGLAHDMLCVATQDGMFQVVNERWTRTLGWSSEELTSRPLVEFVHPDDRDRTKAEAARLADIREETVDFRNRYRTKVGDYRWVDWRAAVDIDTGEIYAAARDVTDSVLLAEQLRTREELLTWMVQEQLRIRDDEQLRISSELHDSAVQHNIAAIMMIDDVLENVADDAVRAQLAPVRTQIAEALASTRKVMHGLDPLDLGDITLENALERLAAEVQTRYGVPLTIELEADLQLRDDLEALLYRMVAECVVNAGKHAQASRVVLAIARESGDLVARVDDDGRGIDRSISEASSRSGAGLGLAFLRERVRSTLGSIDIDSSDDGTRIELRIPLLLEDVAV